MASFDYSGQVPPQQVNYTYQMPQLEASEYVEDTYPEPEGESGKFGQIAALMGAVASVALVVGVGIWGYKLVSRDVSGVPVVRAIEGPMRVQPANPGGTPADHQGLAVNTVAAQGTAAPPPDRLVLAPKPVSLSEDDAPMGDLEPTPVSLQTSDQPVSLSDEAVTSFQNGAVDALVAELTQGVEPLIQDSDQDAAETTQLASIVQPSPVSLTDVIEEEVAIDPADLAALQPDPAVLNAPGVRQSLRPQVRPARAVPSSAAETATLNAAINAAVETAAGLDVDPEGLPVGTRLAQLGAYDTPEVARAEWDRLNSRFGDYMDGKKRVIQKASSGGRTFYRLRAMGFDDLSDARRFCSALVAERADCIPVTTR
ncbi:Sporulation related domain protein [Falsiruegeria litorea R37]|uniref:Sporulation related domain protein n=1 Tax=Falsiruegeria litorea R37 TaxID=1200284 RepID=A0A1Y5SMP1_9RHOB|nr:SPOR domain-containing protein [Falsiruegeria litorea]SLN44127.1 Sporulation related domain protein [Falsiruegeria litorea R37]